MDWGDLRRVNQQDSMMDGCRVQRGGVGHDPKDFSQEEGGIVIY